MSINVYLRGNEVQNLEGFTTELRRGGKPVQEWSEYKLPGVKLWHDKGRWRIMLNEPTEPVPAAVADIVEEISFYEWISPSPSREAGIYRHESAEAEVELDRIGGENRLKIHIRAKKMEDLIELYRKIRVGSIRPVLSYEALQHGLSYPELETMIDRLQAETRQNAFDLEKLDNRLREANEALERSVETSRDLADVRSDLVRLYDEMTKGLPFCLKSTVRKKIFAINNRLSG